MAVTAFQRKICRLIADARKKNGASYIAGGVSLNALTKAPRISHDIDIFNDTVAALLAGWEHDKKLLELNQYDVKIIRERPSFIEALVSDSDNLVVLQWTCDSAFRFFPLVEHEDFGLTLHPVDLATNKALALVGRLEVRDWIDMLTSHDKIQHIGLLFWAACGKDPGFSPMMILSEAKRSGRYTQVEIDSLVFEKETPNAVNLSKKWKRILKESEDIIVLFSPEDAGKCVLNENGELLNGPVEEITGRIKTGQYNLHEGSLHGAYPTILPQHCNFQTFRLGGPAVAGRTLEHAPIR